MTLHLQETPAAQAQKSGLKAQTLPCIYGQENIDQLTWPETEAGRHLRAFLLPLIKKGVHTYVNNIQGMVYALQIEEQILPLLVTDGDKTNSWVCSPYGHYISNGKWGTSLINNRLLSKMVASLISGIGYFCNSHRIDSIVYVNHGLFATDLHDSTLTQGQISKLVSCLTSRFPQHAIAFRSLNQMTNADLSRYLKQRGFKRIASRYVYITDLKNPEVFKTRILKSDLKLCREAPYQAVDQSIFSQEERAEILHLYQKLYTKDHASLNPDFTPAFMDWMVDSALLEFKVIHIYGVIEGVAGYYVRDGVLLCPFFGYDKTRPDHQTIYRILNTALMLEGQKRQVLFQQSAGASFYKKIRRAQGTMEWIAVYTRHLPRVKKISWVFLRAFINTLAPRFMEKY